MSRRALLVGIDTYDQLGALTGCAADARAMAKVLGSQENEDPNYTCRLYCDTADGAPVTRAALRRLLTQLFTDAPGEVLFYFAGHGALTPTGAVLCAADAAEYDMGVSMDEILQLASRSSATSVLLVIDTCHAGSLGNSGLFRAAVGETPIALLRENLTILAAARASEIAMEREGHGAFTGALLDGLVGGAKDLLGLVTAPALYAYVERRFDGWEQRPVYKSHATGVTVVRECTPVLERAKLRRLVEFFHTADAEFQLEPAHDPEDGDGRVQEPVDETKRAIGDLLREYRNARLLCPTQPGEQLWRAMKNGHTVRLTELGREFWWLAAHGKL